MRTVRTIKPIQLSLLYIAAAIFEVSKDPFPFDLNESGRYQNMPRILMYVYFVALGIVVLILEELFSSFEGKTTNVSSLFTKQPSPEPPPIIPLATTSTTKVGYDLKRSAGVRYATVRCTIVLCCTVVYSTA